MLYYTNYNFVMLLWRKTAISEEERFAIRHQLDNRRIPNGAKPSLDCFAIVFLALLCVGMMCSGFHHYVATCERMAG